MWPANFEAAALGLVGKAIARLRVFGCSCAVNFDLCGWVTDAGSWLSWHYEVFVTEQDDSGDGVVERWTILDGAGPEVTVVQL